MHGQKNVKFCIEMLKKKEKKNLTELMFVDPYIHKEKSNKMQQCIKIFIIP